MKYIDAIATVKLAAGNAGLTHLDEVDFSQLAEALTDIGADFTQVGW